MVEDLSQLPGTFPGVRYCKAMQASVDAILAPKGIHRRVVSRGTDFRNRDAWTVRKFVKLLCEALAEYPDRLPNRDELKKLVREANKVRCVDPHIRVAKMPEWVNHRVALAIVGGGYHEAWHTLYSRRDSIRLSEGQTVLDAGAELLEEGGQFNAKLRGLLCSVFDVLEDVRIERRGNAEYPGAIQPLRDLADFILGLEKKQRETAARGMNVTVSTNARSIFLCCLRDVALGYNTPASREAVVYYKETAPETVALLAPGGLLAPLMYEAKQLSLGNEGEIGSLRLAMRFVVALWRTSQDTEDTEDSCDSECACPNCGASASHLVLRPVMTPEGVRISGRAELECRACGYKTEIDIPDGSMNFSTPQEDEEDRERPEVEGSLGLPAADGFGNDQAEALKDAPTPDDDDDGDDDEPGEPVPVSVQGGGGGVATPENEEDDGDGDGGRDVGGREHRDLQGEEPDDGEAPGGGAGGVNLDLGPSPESSLRASEEVLDGDEADGALSRETALEEAVSEQKAEEARDLEDGEMVWNPYDPSLDEALLVQSRNPETDLKVANDLLRRVNAEVTYLRARLRIIFRAQEMVSVEHGVPRGRLVSDRMLVDSRAELLAGEKPKRPYRRTAERIDISLATALVLDQSSSMSAMRVIVAQCLLMLSDAFDAIGTPSMAFGFRNGIPGDASEEFAFSSWDETYHRVRGVRYDVFKGWHEPFSSVKWRFGHTHATGTTPMADGIQYGLWALQERPEAHRVLGVLTDGDPDKPHKKVIRRQVRLAKAAGVHVLGIGITDRARYVKTLFPDHVWVPTIQELPEPLLAKFNDLCDFTGRFRGRRMALDGAPMRTGR